MLNTEAAPAPAELATSLEHVDSLELYPGNPRRGDVAAIRQSLERNGQFRPIVVQRATRQVLAGNHTLQAARAAGWEQISVVWADVDDATARRIVIADNRTAELAVNEDHALAALLHALGGDLEGSGYEQADVDALDALLAEFESHAAEAGSDEDILDRTDAAGWPSIVVQVPPDVKARFEGAPGEDELQKLLHLLNAAGC